MNEEFTEEPVKLHELTELGREKLAQTQDATKEALAVTKDYIKANPWIAVAGAAILGGVLVALARPCKPSPTNLDNVRDWLDEAYAQLPSKSDIQSSGPGKFLKHLAKSLNISS